MKNKKSKKNRNLKQNTDVFFQQLMSAVKNDIDEYVDEDAQNLTIATIELIWDKYNISEFMGGYHLNEKDYDKFYKKNIDISRIKKVLLRHEFRYENIDEIYDEDEKNFNRTFEFVFDRLKSSTIDEADAKKTDLLVGLLKIVQDRINASDSSILKDDITKEEFFKHIDSIFFP
jgi:hypothetical protein